MDYVGQPVQAGRAVLWRSIIRMFRTSVVLVRWPRRFCTSDIFQVFRRFVVDNEGAPSSFEVICFFGGVVVFS